eukprot:1160880-Pelagomonas_calceolata.AAC.12
MQLAAPADNAQHPTFLACKRASCKWSSRSLGCKSKKRRLSGQPQSCKKKERNESTTQSVKRLHALSCVYSRLKGPLVRPSLAR